MSVLTNFLRMNLNIAFIDCLSTFLDLVIEAQILIEKDCVDLKKLTNIRDDMISYIKEIYMILMINDVINVVPEDKKS